MFTLCVARSGLAIMLVAQLGTGKVLFFGRMFGLAGCLLVLGTTCYMT